MFSCGYRNTTSDVAITLFMHTCAIAGGCQRGKRAKLTSSFACIRRRARTDRARERPPTRARVRHIVLATYHRSWTCNECLKRSLMRLLMTTIRLMLKRTIAINARKTRKAPGVDKVEREQKLLIKLISQMYLPLEGTLTSTPQLERVHDSVQLSSFLFVANEGSRCT